MPVSRLNIQYLKLRVRSWLAGEEKVLAPCVTADVQKKASEHSFLGPPVRDNFLKSYSCPHLCEGPLKKLHVSSSDLGLAPLIGVRLELPRTVYCQELRPGKIRHGSGVLFPNAPSGIALQAK